MVHAHNMNRKYEEPLPRIPSGLAAALYCEDPATRNEPLHTRDKDEALRLVAAKNETHAGPAFSRQFARVYWKAGDPAAVKRDWQELHGTH